MPAEWEQQTMVQLTWPHNGTDWKPYLDEIVKTMTEMAVAIAKHEKLLIVTPNTEETSMMLKRQMSEKQWRNTKFFECETNDTWARDHAFITVAEDDGTGCDCKLKLLDFHFNGWGMKFEASKDNAINSKMAESGIVGGVREDNDDFVLEGGSIESDGCGTVFTTTSCLLAPHRNQPMDREQIETELKCRLGASRIIWLNHGNIIGDDTDGHIDTIVRIAPEDTLLYVKCSDEGDEHYEDFMALEKELKLLKTADGKAYRLIPLPFPKAIYDSDGERLPATYANYLIINGAVLVPTYNQPEMDKEACEIIGKAFKNREIIPIDSRVIIRQHGSIHCLTMQYY